MDIAARLLAAAREVARSEARRVAAVTDWGTVTVAAPLEVRFAGDTSGQPIASAVGVTPAVGDVVGLARFGVKWVVIVILEAA